jgi:hypothetical protein
MATEHIVKSYDQQISLLTRKIIEMGGAVEQQLASAVEALVNLPVPTRPDSDTANAWNVEMPFFELFPVNNSRIISRTCLTCTKRVSTEKNNPAPRHRTISALLQMIELRPLTSDCI